MLCPSLSVCRIFTCSMMSFRSLQLRGVSLKWWQLSGLYQAYSSCSVGATSPCSGLFDSFAAFNTLTHAFLTYPYTTDAADTLITCLSFCKCLFKIKHSISVKPGLSPLFVTHFESRVPVFIMESNVQGR